MFDARAVQRRRHAGPNLRRVSPGGDGESRTHAYAYGDADVYAHTEVLAGKRFRHISGGGVRFILVKKILFISTGTQTVSLSGAVTVATAGDDALSMSVSIGNGFETTGEGSYTYDESSGTAHLVDSLGFDVTITFKEEKGQIQMEMVKVYAQEDVTITITLGGPKG